MQSTPLQNGAATQDLESHTYSYGNTDWKDLLTGFDGQSISYDTSGNPLSYYNGKRYTMSWRNGRELDTLTVGGKKTSYQYDVNGLRTKKTNPDGSYTQYYVIDGLTVGERTYTTGGAERYTLRYLYDENNSPVGFGLKYPSETGWTNYYFAKNLQGDVTAVYRSDAGGGSYTGTLVAKYSYDPFGQLLSVTNASGTAISQTAAHVANYNPFRYRGYYYDTESGFYYLQSRYYDPEICRFISADQYASTGLGFLGCNMFAYCNKNPICCEDITGEIPNFKTMETDGGYGGGVGGAGLVVGLGLLIYTGVKNAVSFVTKTATMLSNAVSKQLQNIAEFSSIGSTAMQRSAAKTQTVTASITRAVDKAKAKIARSNRYDYWLAVYIDYGEDRGTYIPTVGLTYSKAIAIVRSGGSVFASSKSKARRLALAVGYGISPERDNAHYDRVTGSNIGYWPHYHDGRRRGGHIFYATY